MGNGGLWTGIGSGALSGATTGSKFGGWGTLAGAVVGGVLGGVGGNADDRAKDEEERIKQAEADKQMRLQQLSLGLGAGQVKRNQGMSALGYLANNRSSAEISGRNRSIRDSILYGGI